MITLFRREIEALFDLPNMAKAVEEAYKAASAGRVKLPPAGHIASLVSDCHWRDERQHSVCCGFRIGELFHQIRS